MQKRDDVLAWVRAAIDELNEELDYDELRNAGEQTPLFGGEGDLDSLSLVNLVVDLEGRIAEATGKCVVLSDEKTMSMRNSPFRDVASLVDLVIARLRVEDA